jgi:hypothetical protein
MPEYNVELVRLMLFTFLRGTLSVVLIIAGTALSLLSIALAFFVPIVITGTIMEILGLSITVTIMAILGLSLMFGGYWIIRNSDGAPLAALYLKLALGFGSTFLVYGLLAAFFGRRLHLPIGYFIAVGFLCVLGFVKFRAYTKYR